MKFKLLCIFILISELTISQNSFYIDSLEITINTLPKEEQLQTILEIPHDKLIGNISKSEILAKKSH
ncbi:hypothetical protein [Lutibacter sp.]